jgi:hypothetical protein
MYRFDFGFEKSTMKLLHLQLLALSMVTVFLMQGCLVAGSATATNGNVTTSSSSSKLNILVLSEDIFKNEPDVGFFQVRMGLDKADFSLTWVDQKNYSLVNPANYNDIVVNSFLPDDAAWLDTLVDAVNVTGRGLLFFGGYYPVFAESNGTRIKALLPVKFEEPFTVESETYIDQSWVSQIELDANPQYNYNGATNASRNSVGLLDRGIVWTSSPLVEQRIFVADAQAGADVLVYSPGSGLPKTNNFKLGEPLVAYWGNMPYGPCVNGRVLYVSMGIGFIETNFSQYTITGAGPFWSRTVIANSTQEHWTTWNKPFGLWPYFNFFLYQSLEFLAKVQDTQIDTYAAWPLSPIPHAAQATWWMIFVAFLWVFNFILFFTLGRRKRSGADLENFEADKAAGEKERQDKEGGGGAGEVKEPVQATSPSPEPEALLRTNSEDEGLFIDKGPRPDDQA